jgi:hypothetical protein
MYPKEKLTSVFIFYSTQGIKTSTPKSIEAKNLGKGKITDLNRKKPRHKRPFCQLN